MLAVPQVSVVLPTFGRPAGLARAAESVLVQSMPGFELIVVDDNDPGSVARRETELVMHGFLGDSRVEYVKHDRNRNGAAARNTGVAGSAAPFICFLDDDDRFLASKVEEQVRALESHPEWDAVTCGWCRGESCQVLIPPADLVKALLMMEYHPITSTLMFRREALEAIGCFDESFRRHQDVELMIRFSQRFRLGFLEQCLVEIGENDGENALHGKDLDLLKERFLEQFADTIHDLEQDEPGLARRLVARHFGRNFLDHAHRGRLHLAGSAAVRSISASPGEFAHTVASTLGDYLAHRRHRRVDASGGRRA